MGGWRETEDSYSEMHEGSFFVWFVLQISAHRPVVQGVPNKATSSRNEATFLVNIER